MNLKDKANVLLFSDNSSFTEQSVLNAVRKNWTVPDAGLIIRHVPLPMKLRFYLKEFLLISRYWML